MATILLPLDGSPFAEQALPHALSRCRSSDRLLLLRVVAPDDSHAYVESHLADREQEQAQAYLEALAGRLRAEGWEVGVRVAVGMPREEILACARSEQADLLVMSSHGRTGWKRWVLGSVAESVARESPCPLWLIRCAEPEPREAPGPLERVLVPLDLSLRSDRTLAFAEQWLNRQRVTLILLTAARSEAARDLEERAERLRQQGWRVECRLEAPSAPAATILDVAYGERADLIAMSSRGRSGLERLLIGSVAEQVVRHATCPVALIPTRS